MINILSYIGMNMHSEVCLWTLLGLVRTIFDATLFKVNANLKQVWQMSMPEELSVPVQRALRTMISGVMLVQCFTVYVYLASYIVLLYPVFLEERPTLVLPWLLLAATRKLLCELTSLALGLGTCVLLGPARPPCIKFVIVKLVSIMPAFYMWMLVFSYYHVLKVASTFKTFTTALPPSDHDLGLELAIRRRKTKSLLGEEQLRTKIVASLYGERAPINNQSKLHPNVVLSSFVDDTSIASNEEIKTNIDVMLTPTTTVSNRMSETGSCEDWYGSDVLMSTRNADRILEQFVLMMLRIGTYLSKEGVTSVESHTLRQKSSHVLELPRLDSHNCSTIPTDDTDTPSFVGSSKGNTASYVRDYPQIFMKRPSDFQPSPEIKAAVAKSGHNRSRIENDGNGKTVKTRRRTVSISPNNRVFMEVERNKRVIWPENKNLQQRIPPDTKPQSQSPKILETRVKSIEQPALKNGSRETNRRGIDLNKMLSSSDSLRSELDFFYKNKKVNEAAESSAQTHEKKD